MVLSNEVCHAQLASGMPTQIVQGAQYMNDAVVSACGKLSQAINYPKNSEFYGGIWDTTSVKETAPVKPPCIETSNNLAPKMYSLDEMLLSDDEVATNDDAEMKDDLSRNQNKEAEFNANASCIDVSVDSKTKRYLYEESDKASLIPSNESETVRKKSKKNVTFSDIIVDLENSSKSAGEYVPMHNDDRSSLKETVIKEDEKIENSVTLVPENANDVPMKKENKVNSMSQKSCVKASKKVKNWTKMMSQSNEIDQNQQMTFVESSKKLSSHEKRRSQTSKSDKIVERTLTKTSANISKEKNEESMKSRMSRLESAIPELFLLSDIKTEDKPDSKPVKKTVKDESKCVDDNLTDIRNLKLDIKKKNSLSKNSHSHTELNSSETKVESRTSKEVNVCNELETKESRLVNSLLELFDFDMAKSLKNKIMEIAKQEYKNVHGTEKDKIMSNDMQKDDAAMIRQEKLPPRKSANEQTCNASRFFSEDESEFEMDNSLALKQKKSCCPPICEKPSCNLQNLEKNGNMEQDFVKNETDSNASDYKPVKLSATSYDIEENLNQPVSSSRSNSCSNWRSQCIDVRLKDTEENKVPQSSSTANWRSNCRNPKSQPDYTARPINHKTRRASNMDASSKVEYEGDNMVVVPIYLKEPPTPLSRFKGINADPESIWDSCEEKTMPTSRSSRSQSKIDYFDVKNDKEEVHAQLFRKSKTSVPRFFDNPNRTSKSNKEMCGDVNPSPKAIGGGSSRTLNENRRSRSQFRQENAISHRSYERNRSASTQWRSSLAMRASEHDIFYIVKIKSLQDGTIEKLQILKEEFLSVVRANNKLLDIIPSPGPNLMKISYSASAVGMFIRSIFILSYKISSWMTVLEGFALAKKYGVKNLKAECEANLANYKIPSEEIQQVAACAQQLQVIEALKSSKSFQKVQDFKSFSSAYKYKPQSCTVSCSVLVDPSEFVIPLTTAVNRGLESCNEVDVSNRVFFTSLAPVTYVSGIQLKFLTEDVPQQKIICEVFHAKKGGGTKDRLFDQELDTKAKSSVKISFEDEVTVKCLEEIEISVYMVDVPLKICPLLSRNEVVVSQGKFRAKFESTKTGESNRSLFCIEKMFYTQAP